MPPKFSGEYRVVRCEHRTRGVQCKRMTHCTHLCTQHQISDYGVRVKYIGKNMGYGIIAARDLPRGHEIPYADRRHIVSESERRDNAIYEFESIEGVIYDANATTDLIGRYMNASDKEVKELIGYQPIETCEWVENNIDQVISMRLIKDVAKGDQLFINYGSGYWRPYISKNRKK